MTTKQTLLRAAGYVAAACVLAASSSCGRDAGTAPAAEGVQLARRGMFSIEPVFPRLVSGKSLADVVQFEKVRVVLHRADGSVALDTLVLFPVGADSVVLAANVPLSPSAGNAGENFKLDLGYMNAAGEVVFRGGPVDLTVLPKGSSTTPAPVQIPVKYSGPGATATRVAISPRSVSVTENQSFSFSATALDAAGSPQSATPIVWASLDPSRAVLNSTLGGSGRSLGVRGTARIVAQLLTGPADTVTVNITLSAKSIALQSGDGQKGEVGKPLPQPIAVKVTASDGIGVGGVSVSFAVATGAGSVGSSTVTTDANGIASTTWTLGARSGAQSVTASAAGLTGSPITFGATARSYAPVKLVFASAPAATNAAGSPLALTVNAVDDQGEIAKDFTGTVALALAPSSPAGGLLGTLSAAAAQGVASFGDVRINVPGTGFAISASASGLIGATTGTFAIVPGPATRLEFAAYPVSGAVAGGLETVNVVARDAVGNLATSFAGRVTVSQRSGATGFFTGTMSQTAVAGIASFGDLSITRVGDYALNASASGVSDAVGPAFSVRAGPAASLTSISGSGQFGAAGSTLARAIVFGLADRFMNPVARSGVTVSFSANAGGSASPSSATTDATGRVQTSWTLGGLAASQMLVASSSGLSNGAATATATAPTGGSGAGGDLILVDDVNMFDNSYGTPNVGNSRFIKNLVNFSGSGARASGTKVLAINDGNMYYGFTTNWTQMGSIFSGEGYSTTELTGPSSHTALLSIASDVKLVIINNPVYAFSVSEINALKTFSSQGGRILFVGENPAYYYESYRTNVENDFLAKMGSSITVVGTCDAPGEFISTVSHQVTTGVAASGSGSIYMNCASYHTGHGARDTAIGTTGTGRVVISAVKVNTTPIALPSLRALIQDGASPRTLGPPESTVAPPRRPRP